MPFIRERTPTFNLFGSSALEDIYGTDALKNAFQAQVTTLSHIVFLKTDTGYLRQPLPIWAQFAPGFGVNVADFNGDGHEDIFMAQNFFATQIETNRLDAGRGLLLTGDGTGNLQPLPGHLSGIMVYGEQRGSAVADYNADGRPDLLVTQNGNRTRLFKNQLGKFTSIVLFFLIGISKIEPSFFSGISFLLACSPSIITERPIFLPFCKQSIHPTE